MGFYIRKKTFLFSLNGGKWATLDGQTRFFFCLWVPGGKTKTDVGNAYVCVWSMWDIHDIDKGEERHRKVRAAWRSLVVIFSLGQRGCRATGHLTRQPSPAASVSAGVPADDRTLLKLLVFQAFGALSTLQKLICTVFSSGLNKVGRVYGWLQQR